MILVVSSTVAMRFTISASRGLRVGAALSTRLAVGTSIVHRRRGKCCADSEHEHGGDKRRDNELHLRPFTHPIVVSPMRRA
jgi:hypothetical protein